FNSSGVIRPWDSRTKNVKWGFYTSQVGLKTLYTILHNTMDLTAGVSRLWALFFHLWVSFNWFMGASPPLWDTLH
ncbi:hypothetical protein, partial [Psychrobacillus sp. MER TA 171]|uniref:hypothetical protein n=1 Tax=Psychrobacillus sp. MER TA 171 TaxID=2939577 RepID=UPI00203EB594